MERFDRWFSLILAVCLFVLSCGMLYGSLRMSHKKQKVNVIIEQCEATNAFDIPGADCNHIENVWRVTGTID
jgi:hypothetical protein